MRAAVLFGLLIALVCSQTFELRAQTFRIHPEANLYLPTKISVQHGLLRVQQKLGMIFGVTAVLSFNDRFDIATNVTYLPGYALLSAAGRRFEAAGSAHRLSAGTRARYWLRPPDRPLSWEVHTGLGLTFGGTPAYQELFDRSTLAAVLGTRVRYRLLRVVRLELQVQTRLYGLRFGSRAAGNFGPPLQVTFGLGFAP